MKYLLIIAFLFVSYSGVSQDLRTLYASGKLAYDSGRYQEALRLFESFDSIRSNYPPVNSYLAMIYSRTGNTSKSLEYLVKTGLINADTSLLGRPDFDPVRDSQEFDEIGVLFLSMLDTLQRSELAFTIADKGFHPESIAFDRENSRFYIGSIRKRKIIVYEGGNFREFKATGEDGLMAVTGMDIDNDAGVLWVCSAFMKQMEIKNQGESGSMVHAYDLEAGDLLFSHRLPGEDILLGDLVLDRLGLPLMTNSITPEIFRADADSAWQWKEFPDLYNLQGLAVDGNGGIFFSDYILGIYHLSADEILQRIEHTSDISTKGIDGMYYRNGNLVALQNGVFPMRVTQFTLDKTRRTIERATYLDKNISDLNEPVQGTWVGDWFYFISNSPWRYYDEDSRLLLDQVPNTQVRRVNLVGNQDN